MLITSRPLMGGCPVCGREHAACGGPSTSTPVDVVVDVPPREPTMEQHEMLRVRIGPNDIRRVHPRDKDRFMATYPGAEVLDDAKAKDDDEPAMKAQAPAENKAMKAPEKK